MKYFLLLKEFEHEKYEIMGSVFIENKKIFIRNSRLKEQIEKEKLKLFAINTWKFPSTYCNFLPEDYIPSEEDETFIRVAFVFSKFEKGNEIKSYEFL